MKAFLCPDCRLGRVALRAVSGRRAMVFRGLEVELPASLELGTCDHCLTYTVTSDQEAAFEEAVQQSLLSWQRDRAAQMVDEVCTRHKLTRQQLASALGITPSHLSHICSGSKPASTTLLRLLAVFRALPDAIELVLEGVALEDFKVTPGPALRGEADVFEALEPLAFAAMEIKTMASSMSEDRPRSRELFSEAANNTIAFSSLYEMDAAE